MKFIVNPRLRSLGYKTSEVYFYFYYCNNISVFLMHLSMLSLGAGYPGREFNLPAILEDQQNLEMSYPPSWYREDFWTP